MKNTIIIFSLINLLSLNIYSQSFDKLKKLESFGSELYYVPTKTELINKQVESEAYEVYFLVKTSLNNTAAKYAIYFDDGPSSDPGFTIYEISGKTENQIIRLDGSILILPGNGYIYTRGRNNENYTKTRKYQFANNTFTEVKQAAYYVGVKSKTATDIILLSNFNKTASVVAQIPKGYEVEILANIDTWYLVKTQFGLLGWVEITPEQCYPQGSVIEDIYFAGD